jgi:hypothetical protein
MQYRYAGRGENIPVFCEKNFRVPIAIGMLIIRCFGWGNIPVLSRFDSLDALCVIYPSALTFLLRRQKKSNKRKGDFERNAPPVQRGPTLAAHRAYQQYGAGFSAYLLLLLCITKTMNFIITI